MTDFQSLRGLFSAFVCDSGGIIFHKTKCNRKNAKCPIYGRSGKMGIARCDPKLHYCDPNVTQKFGVIKFIL